MGGREGGGSLSAGWLSPVGTSASEAATDAQARRKKTGGGGGGVGSGGLWVWRISPLTQRQHCGVLSTSHLLCSVDDGFTPVQCFPDAVPSAPVKVTPKSDSLKQKNTSYR